MSIVKPPTIARGPQGETAEFVHITPELAASWLALNIEHNRSLKSAKIAGYVRDIQSGNWVLTGEAIKFDTDGRLIDGQNRLTAVSQSGVPVWMLVVRNVKPEALINIDSGNARNTADMLTITGISEKADAKDVAAVARLYNAYRNGDVKHAASHIGGTAQLTKAEMAEVVMSIPDIEFAARYARNVYRFLRIPIGALGVAFIEFTKIDVGATGEFFDRIRDGIQHGPGDPFTTLSRRVTQDFQGGAARRILPGTGLFYLFRTWNAWRDGETLTKLQTGSATSGWTPLPAPH